MNYWWISIHFTRQYNSQICFIINLLENVLFGQLSFFFLNITRISKRIFFSNDKIMAFNTSYENQLGVVFSKGGGRILVGSDNQPHPYSPSSSCHWPLHLVIVPRQVRYRTQYYIMIFDRVFQMIVMYPKPNVITCISRVWLREIGFSLTYGALMLKTWRYVPI